MKESTDLESIFCKVSEGYLREQKCFSTRGELGVFSHASVIWLGIQQRLSGNSLQSSMCSLIERIREDNSPLNLILRPGKRVRDDEISLNTGGVSRARDRLSESIVSGLFDEATRNIERQISDTENIFVLDGQVITISRTESTLEDFGSTGNGSGELHFPRIRVVSAHHLKSGVAKALAIGSWKDGEVKLATEVLQSIPSGSVVIMDRFFDKPTFLAKAQERGIKVVVRIRELAARRLFGKLPKDACAEKGVTWIPSLKELKHIAIPGRVVKYTAEQSGFRSSEFFFFSTLDNGKSLSDIATFYRQRVMVEVFIRQLKQTLKLFFVRAKKADNVRKEIYISYLTFNLLRAIMHHAAKKGGVEEERISFTATVSLCQTYALSFLKARTSQERLSLYEKFVRHLLQAKIPKRNKERSYPRVIKHPRDKYKTAGIARSSTIPKKEGK
jgi:hypothetical protein